MNLLDTPFENINPCDFDTVITGLQERLRAADVVVDECSLLTEHIGMGGFSITRMIKALKKYQEFKKALHG